MTGADRQMTARQAQAFALAEKLIQQAKAEGWQALHLGGEGEVSFGAEERVGTYALSHLSQLPKSLADLTELHAFAIDATQVNDLKILAKLPWLLRFDADDCPISDLAPIDATRA